MTAAERNLHDILNSWASTLQRYATPRVVREVCPTCAGSGQCARSSWDRPQMHVERCVSCAGTGRVSRECAP